MKVFLFLVIFISTLHVSAQNIVISDVDDTLKLAHAPSLTGSLEYARDSQSHFTGLNSLFQLILQDDTTTSFFYVSSAPEWLMKKTHLAFLKNTAFPAGNYVGLTNNKSDEHKLIEIRKIINQLHPKRVLFVGDNGQIDAKVYATIVNEFAPQGIEFVQYIHIVYTANDLKAGAMIPLTPDQIGFVTAIELAEDLRQKNWLSSASEMWMRQNIMPLVLNEKPGAEQGAVAFPDFMNCKDIQWRWDIPGLNEKIKQVCH
jgi:hypothetical protein